MSALRHSDNENMLSTMNVIHMCLKDSILQAGNSVKEILLKLNLPDHRSILTDSKVNPTKHGRMTKPYSSPNFIANCFIVDSYKDGDEGSMHAMENQGRKYKPIEAKNQEGEAIEVSCLSPQPIIILSDSDIEDTFSSTHSLDYISASLDYFPASPGNTSPNFSDDLTKDLLASLALSPFYDDPYMKVMQAYDATDNELPQAPITPPAILPLSLVLSLSPMFDSQHFFPPEKISPPKDTKTPVESPILISPSSSVGSSSPVRSTTPPPDYPFDKSIFAELDNSLWIIPQPLGSEPVPEKPNESDAC
ncbi:hypothetical protein Tco_0500166 [Tanacetum coccineum]